jgi:hypothetical protein
MNDQQTDRMLTGNTGVLDKSARYSASSFAQPVGKVVTDRIPTGNVDALIPTGNELHSSFAQPVGNVVLRSD